MASASGSPAKSSAGSPSPSSSGSSPSSSSPVVRVVLVVGAWSSSSSAASSSAAAGPGAPATSSVSARTAPNVTSQAKRTSSSVSSIQASAASPGSTQILVGVVVVAQPVRRDRVLPHVREVVRPDAGRGGRGGGIRRRQVAFLVDPPTGPHPHGERGELAGQRRLPGLRGEFGD